MKPVPLGIALLALVAFAAHAEVATPITVKSPWLRATPKSAPVAGGYATIVNSGTLADRLVGASLPIAAEGQVHAMSMQNGVMHMERMKEGLTIPAGGTVTLMPSGNHLMFIKPTARLKEGDVLKGSLIFEKAGPIPVTFTVAGMAAKNAPGTKGHDAKGMDGMDMPGMSMPGR